MRRLHKRLLTAAAVLLGVLLISACCLFLMMAGALFAFETPFYLAAGWVFFLADTLPRVRVDPAAVASAALGLAALLAGLHLFLGWLYGAGELPRRWPWRWTLALVALVGLMFAGGLCAVGVARHAGWLLTAKEPFVQRLTVERFREVR
jgi:hypothetical protein